jgi:hypothetical protein
MIAISKYLVQIKNYANQIIIELLLKDEKGAILLLKIARGCIIKMNCHLEPVEGRMKLQI